MKMKLYKKSLSSAVLFLSIILSSCTTSSSTSLLESDETSEHEHDFLSTALYENRVAWGLGEKMTKYVTNDRDYEWYVDQLNTGEHWAENCGPSSVEMVGRYYDPAFSYTAEYARSLYNPDGGWWYDRFITGAFWQFEIPFASITIHNASVLMHALDQGNVVLINPTMELVSREKKSTHRTGIYYTPGTGHYIVVKGYVIVDEVTFFEVYDPWSIDMRYADGTLKGKDRYYDAVSLLDSLKNWFRVGHTIKKIEAL
ncbi:MAG TPA: C39 family peptidase [Bacilli bacterium]|nr:C39 family peptidase [Bacilli bacterium]